MRKFADLEKEGYKGGDASLETSLFEYGLIWKEEEKEITFIYGVASKEEDHEMSYCSFDWSAIEKDVDPKEEWNWVKWDDVMRFVGLDEEDFFSNTLIHIISDLISYYGTEEIFGTAYYPFEIEKED